MAPMLPSVNVSTILKKNTSITYHNRIALLGWPLCSRQVERVDVTMAYILILHRKLYDICNHKPT